MGGRQNPLCTATSVCVRSTTRCTYLFGCFLLCMFRLNKVSALDALRRSPSVFASAAPRRLQFTRLPSVLAVVAVRGSRLIKY